MIIATSHPDFLQPAFRVALVVSVVVGVWLLIEYILQRKGGWD